MSSTRRRELTYPFPLDGFMCQLRLPADGLTRREAERLKEYIDSLTTRDVSDHISASREARAEAQRERAAMRQIRAGDRS